MSVYAEAKRGDEVIKTMLVKDYETALAWLDRHWGEWDEAQLRVKRVEDLRQGERLKNCDAE